MLFGGVEVQLVVPSGAPAPTPSTSVSTPPPSSPPALPRTGLELLALLALAVALLVLGTLLLRVRRAGRT